MKRWRYFELSEFACQGQDCCGGESRMDHDFVHLLDHMRHQTGFPWPISSGYRCPRHNSRVSRTGLTGPHTTGRAVDVRVFGAQAHEITRIALLNGITGLGSKQHGDTRYLHLDNLTQADGFPRPMIWTYP